MTGREILNFRLQLGISQQELGKLLGVSQPAISQAENGKIQLAERHQERIKQHFKNRKLKAASMNR